MLTDENVQKSYKALLAKSPDNFRPRVGIVLGTGLSSLADSFDKTMPSSIVPYSDLPGYPQSTVQSHTGRFHMGWISGVPVILQEGRCHLYEGYGPSEVCRGVFSMASMGADHLFITNSAGSLNPLFPAGGLMLITDHINFTGIPAIFGPVEFTDMCKVYDQTLQRLAEEKALENGIQLNKGIYIGVHGPQMETPAETRMYRHWGADAVGMSTVMEVIAARRIGMRVLGISSLSNQNLPDCMQPAPIEEVIKTSAQSAVLLKRLILSILGSVEF